MSDYTEPFEQQKDAKEDPLKNWTRLQNEECPVCMLPLPFVASEDIYCVTCGKTVCVGCVVSTAEAHRRDGGDAQTAVEKALTCPYCRSNYKNDEAELEQLMKRANAGNHEAMYRLGLFYFNGKRGLQLDKVEGLKWYHRALDAGDGMAAFSLGNFYDDGDGVEQDKEKALEYYQKAADLGYAPSFYIMGSILMNRGEIEEAMFNYRKAAMCGLSDGYIFKALRDGFKYGYINKEEYAYTLRENQKASNEMKSDGREKWKHS